MGVFAKIFGSKPTVQVDLSVLKIDMHSHFIPGIDDGVRTIEESIVLLKEMKALGYKKVITTPHIQSEFFKNTPKIILSGLHALKSAALQAEIDIEIEAAAEYLIDDGFEKQIESGDLLTFGDKYILVELSYYMPYPNLFTVIFNLQLAGYKVILAHPERYTYWFDQMNKFEELKDRGVLFQLNIISLGGYYDIGVKKIAEQLIKRRYYNIAGTDMHNQNYLEGLKIAIQTPAFDILLKTNALINSSL
jgi:protein-tyrosine phosphatase